MFEASVLNGLTRLSIEIGSSKSRIDDDFMDRVNHSYTTTILMICTLIVLGRQFIGKPIACWTPNEFTGAQVEYATLTCWITSTYFINPEQVTIPSDLQIRHKDSINYYQWVPFLLMFQAAMFSIPCIIWRLFNWQSRIHLWTVMDLASKAGDLDETIHSSVNHLQYVIRHLEDALVIRHRRKQTRQNQSSTSTSQTIVSTSITTNDRLVVKDNSWYNVLPLTVSHRSRVPGPRPCSPHSSSYLIGLYLIVKALYVFNSTGQLFLLMRFLGQTTIFYGPQMLLDLIAGTNWYKSGNFPRVTFCDFDMRRMGSNNHRHTLQCVLGINMFNEKIFIFLWFWLVFITLLNIHSFLGWCCRSTFETNRVLFVRNLLFNNLNYLTKNKTNPPTTSTNLSKTKNSGLELESNNHSVPSSSSSLFFTNTNNVFDENELLTETDKKASSFFTEYILGQDGVFVLRLVALNISTQIASKIACQIWERYKHMNDQTKLNNKTKITQKQSVQNTSSTPPLPIRKDKLKLQKSTDLLSCSIHSPSILPRFASSHDNENDDDDIRSHNYDHNNHLLNNEINYLHRRVQRSKHSSSSSSKDHQVLMDTSSHNSKIDEIQLREII